MSEEQQPMRIVVELVQSADVKRLEARDEDLRKEIQQLEKKIEGLHRTLYESLEAVSRIRNSR